MLIGDDWLTKTMVVQTLYRNDQLRSQMGASNLGKENLFSSILNSLLIQQESQIPMEHKLNSYIPTMNPTTDSLVSDYASGVNRNKESLNFQPIRGEKLDQVLNGKLTGMGQAFVTVGEQYNVNPALLASIAIHETGNGKSQAVHSKNNIAGMMGYNGLKSYASTEDSLRDMARNLSKNYIGQGLSSISSIGMKYAPVGADNDPTGLNNHWVKGVSKYFDRLSI